MKRFLTDLLVCPTCPEHNGDLACRATETHGDDILTGTLECAACGAVYPVREGIASLLPASAAPLPATTCKYETASVLSSYVWSHYSELFFDPDANTAYREWAAYLRECSGLALDAGCAAGRFTFELAQKSDFAVGVDYSRSCIRIARELMTRQRLTVPLPVEGKLVEEVGIALPEAWSADRVEFIVADAQALPFRSELFSAVASLNVIDKVRQPLLHLKELNRVAWTGGCQLLISDPFSWSADTTAEEHWLGGTIDGPYAGRGLDNLVRLLSGGGGELSPRWHIERQGCIWWRIRNHANHFELVRSRCIQASR
jgi:uncharacterized protein YbaR (Trm112 family)/2-polyprenyl-3-methyl-5-hydroxy-6-metoxy-1,4-benzoquinol methylase